MLNATDRETMRPVVGEHNATVAIDIQEAGTRAAYRTAPTVAVGADIVEQTIAVGATSRHGKF
jgi:hypothetical protein